MLISLFLICLCKTNAEDKLIPDVNKNMLSLKGHLIDTRAIKSMSLTDSFRHILHNVRGSELLEGIHLFLSINNKNNKKKLTISSDEKTIGVVLDKIRESSNAKEIMIGGVYLITDKKINFDLMQSNYLKIKMMPAKKVAWSQWSKASFDDFIEALASECKDKIWY